MKFRGPGESSAVSYWEIAPHSAIRAWQVDLPEHGVEDLAADVVEEDVDPVGTRLAQPRRDVLRLVVDPCVEAELVG